MRTIFCFVAVYFMIAAPLSVAAMPSQLTVHLFESHAPSKRLNLDGPFEIVDVHKLIPPGRYYCQSAGGVLHLRSAERKHPLNFDGRAFALAARSDGGIGVQYSTSAHRYYLGLLKMSIDPSGNLRVDNVIDVRHYVTSVVGSESAPQFPLECLKAQAILTLTRISLLRPLETFGDSTQQESYFGREYERPLVKQAVSDVWGSTLTYKNKPIHVFYHSTCAGKTSSAFEVFGDGAKNMPYSKCVPCDFCQASPFWKPTVTKVPLARFKARIGGVPTIETLDCAQRPRALTLRQDNKTVDLSGYQFWIRLGQNFGWDKAPGNRFKLSQPGDFVQIESTGAGHGVGMCQWGAAGMASHGKTCTEILHYYYPGTEISRRK